MHSSPTKMHSAGAGQAPGHHGHSGGQFHWQHGQEMPMGAAAGGARGENMPLDPSGMHHFQSQQQQFHGGGGGHPYPPLGHGQQQQQHNRGMAGAGAGAGAGATDDVEVMSTDSSSSSSTGSN